MLLRLFAALVLLSACSAKPVEPPIVPIDGQFSAPVSLRTEAAFDSSGVAIITLHTELAAELTYSAGGAESSQKVPLTRDGTAWKGRIENLPHNDEGTLVVQLGEAEPRKTFFLEWSHATALQDATSGVHSADGMFELELDKGAMPAGTRLSALGRPATMKNRKLVLGPYQLTSNQNVSGRGVFSLPPEETGEWSRWNFRTAQVLGSTDGKPFAPVTAVPHAALGRFTFGAQAPATYLLVVELEGQP